MSMTDTREIRHGLLNTVAKRIYSVPTELQLLEHEAAEAYEVYLKAYHALAMFRALVNTEPVHLKEKS